MELNKAFALKLSKELDRLKITKYKLEKETGISHGTMRNIFNEVNKDLWFSTMAKIVFALNMSLGEFFSDEIFEKSNLNFDK